MDPLLQQIEIRKKMLDENMQKIYQMYIDKYHSMNIEQKIKFLKKFNKLFFNKVINPL